MTMLITASSPNTTLVRANNVPKNDTSVTLHNEPIDGWNPGESKAMADLAPFSFAAIAAAAGLAAGFADGPLAVAGGAVAVGAAGAAGAYFMSGLSELGNGKPNYNLNALIGAGIGAAAGGFAGSVGGPVVGIGAAVLGAGGAYLMTNFLN